jgi:hypothetical protein
MRTQPRSTTPGRRVALLVAAALLLGAGSVAFDAATAHAAVSIGPQESMRPPSSRSTSPGATCARAARSPPATSSCAAA